MSAEGFDGFHSNGDAQDDDDSSSAAATSAIGAAALSA
jgi:hypothetical protein